MDIVKNTKPKAIPMKGADTNKVKNDALSVKYSLIGKDYGVLVVDVY